MSRSRKRSPIFTHVGNGNKKSKQLCNRKFRKLSRIAILKNTLCPVRKDEVMTEYDFLGDGKFYMKNAPDNQMRK